ncbi:hypothetical protein F4803DRAFT_568535 [Xylaria telfairii]|nr:hypothetical protein F4803DRAFT_568535 [Xylaria telfairii]
MALQSLANNPQKLDRARSRFIGSPPLFVSSPSGTTTEWPTPGQPDEEQRWLSQRRFQLEMEYRASFPSSQFEAQVDEEWNKAMREDEMDPRFIVLGQIKYGAQAKERVKKRWVEQGIWNENWKEHCGMVWRWKHEEPLEAEADLYTEPKTANANLYSSSPIMESSGLETGEKAEGEKIQQIERAQTIKEREREASRPLHQFFYQLTKESERMLHQLRNSENNEAIPSDIHMMAAERVKNTWMERKIWDSKWGPYYPGRSWKHEQPLEKWLEEEMSKVTYSPPPNPHESNSPFTFTDTNLREFRSVSPSPAEANQEVFSATNLYHQESPLAINLQGELNTVHKPASGHESPPSPPREKRRRGRPSRGSEKPRVDRPLQDPPEAPRRSRRLQEAKSAAGLHTMAGSIDSASRTGRPKRGGTKAGVSAQAVPEKESRASKRQRKTRK